MSITIKSLEIENVKRIKAVELTPSPTGLTVIGGKNGQGKTSVLDSIAWALGGERFRPSNATREGSVVPPTLKITMANGLVVERKGKNSDLRLNDYGKNVDISQKNGIINSRGGGMGISIEIDRFTPCLVETATGKIIQTKYQRINKSDLVGLKKQGWLFNWNADDLNNATVYKLLAEGDDRIQGLVALTDFERSKAIYVNIAESAPHNRGSNKVYEGVGGHLFAIAANESVQKGYGGFLFMDAKNMELVNYYREKFGAALLGMPHPYRMFIDEENADKLLEIYTLKGE